MILMKNIMDHLFALQTLQFQSGSGQRNLEGTMAAIRKTIPGPVLAHYDRLLARGKKGVAVVRNGVCTECHIRVATGALAGLAHGTDIQLCGNCGRYLFLPADEPVIPAGVRPPVKTARRKKESLALAG
jgi:predicted  nucleic acid-binding Zn-ribbon protein